MVCKAQKDYKDQKNHTDQINHKEQVRITTYEDQIVQNDILLISSRIAPNKDFQKDKDKKDLKVLNNKKDQINYKN